MVPFKIRKSSGGSIILVGSSTHTQTLDPVQLLGAAAVRRKDVATFHRQHGVDGGGTFGVLSEARVRSRVLLLGTVDLQGAVVVNAKPRPVHGIRRIVFAPEKRGRMSSRSDTTPTVTWLKETPEESRKVAD